MITLLILAAAALGTVLGTHAIVDRARVRLRLAYHRWLTRRHGRMLQRARTQAAGGGWQ